MVNSNENGKGISKDYTVKDQIAATLTPTPSSSTNSNKNQTNEIPNQHTIHDDALAVMKAQLKEAQKDLQSQNKTILTLSSENKQYKIDLEQMQLTLKNRDIFKKGQTTRINNLIADLKAEQEEVQRLKVKLKNKKSGADSEAYENQIKELQMTITELTVKLRETEGDYSELITNYDRLVKQSSEAMKAKDEVDGISQALSDSREEVIRLEQIITQERQKYENKIKQLTAEYEGVTSELNKIKSREDIETNKIIKLTEDLGKQTLIAQEATRAEINLQQQLDQIQAHALELEQKSADLQEQLTIAMKQQEETTKLHDELSAKIELAEQERAHLKAELEKANEVAATLQQENTSFKEQHVDCLSKAEVESLQAKLQGLQKDLETSLSERQELQAEVEAKVKGIQSQQKEINELHEKIKSMEGVNQMAVAEKIELEKKLVSMEKDLESMANLCNDYEQRAVKAEGQAQAFKDLAKMYGAVVAGVASASPEAEKLFDDELGRHIGSYMHLIDLL